MLGPRDVIRLAEAIASKAEDMARRLEMDEDQGIVVSASDALRTFAAAIRSTNAATSTETNN